MPGALHASRENVLESRLRTRPAGSPANDTIKLVDFPLRLDNDVCRAAGVRVLNLHLTRARVRPISYDGTRLSVKALEATKLSLPIVVSSRCVAGRAARCTH